MVLTGAKIRTIFQSSKHFIKKVRTAEAIRSLFNSSRRMSLGGRLCYTIFLTMGTGPAMIELAIMRSQFGHRYKINYKLSLK